MKFGIWGISSPETQFLNILSNEFYKDRLLTLIKNTLSLIMIPRRRGGKNMPNIWRVVKTWRGEAATGSPCSLPQEHFKDFLAFDVPLLYFTVFTVFYCILYRRQPRTSLISYKILQSNKPIVIGNFKHESFWGIVHSRAKHCYPYFDDR